MGRTAPTEGWVAGPTTRTTSPARRATDVAQSVALYQRPDGRWAVQDGRATKGADALTSGRVGMLARDGLGHPLRNNRARPWDFDCYVKRPMSMIRRPMVIATMNPAGRIQAIPTATC